MPALYPGALDEPVTVGGLGGKTLLVYASYENKVALINRLLEAGSDTCAKDANGEFPLLAAVLRRKWHLVRGDGIFSGENKYLIRGTWRLRRNGIWLVFVCGSFKTR